MKNKLLIISTALLMFLASNIAYGYGCSTNTPNGTKVYMTCHSSEPLSAAQIAATNQAADQQFPNASRWGNASGKYNCHSYAWWWTNPSNYAWMNTPNDDKYWNDGSYSAANWSSSSRISYVYGDHSGRNYPGNIGYIHSKWGAWPRMYHWYTDCPYNSSSYNLYN